jgi:hypothetical protein
MTKASRFVILAEDQHHQRFVRRYLERLGCSKHEIHSEPFPNGRGSGEQWVRRHYTEQVQAFRYRSRKAETALIVVIDADTEGERRTTPE